MANLRKYKLSKPSKCDKKVYRKNLQRRSSLRSVRYKHPSIKASFARVRRHTSFVVKKSEHNVKSSLAEDTITSPSKRKSEVCSVVPIQHCDEGIVTSVERKKSNSVIPVQRKDVHCVTDVEEDRLVVSGPSSFKATPSASSENSSLDERSNTRSIQIFKKRPLLVDCDKKIGKNAKRLVSSKINKIFRNKKHLNKNSKNAKNVFVVDPLQSDVITQCSTNTRHQISVDSLLSSKNQELLKVTESSPYEYPSCSRSIKKSLNNSSKISALYSSPDERKTVNENSEKILVDSKLGESTQNFPEASSNTRPSRLARRKSKRIKRSITTCDKEFVSNDNAESFQGLDEVKCSIINKYLSDVENNLLRLKQEEICSLTKPSIHVHNLFSRHIKNNVNHAVKKTSRHSSFDDKEKVRKILDNKLLTTYEELPESESPEKSILVYKSSLHGENSVVACDKEFISDEKVAPFPRSLKRSPSSLFEEHSHSVEDDEIAVDIPEVSVETVSTKKHQLKSRKNAKPALSIALRKKPKNAKQSLSIVLRKKSKLKSRKGGKKVLSSGKIVHKKKPIVRSKNATEDDLMFGKRSKNHDNHLTVKKKKEKLCSTRKGSRKSSTIICTQTPAKNCKKPSSAFEKKISRVRNKSLKQVLNVNDPSLENIPLDSSLSPRTHETPSSTCVKQIYRGRKKSSKQDLNGNDLSLENIPLDSSLSPRTHETPSSTSVKQVSRGRKKSSKQVLNGNDPSLENIPLDSLLPPRDHEAPSSACEKQMPRDRRKSFKQVLNGNEPSLANIPLDVLFSSRNNALPCEKPQAGRKRLLSDSDLYSVLSFSNAPLDIFCRSSRENPKFKVWLSKCVADSDYEDDLYDPEDFEKFKTVFQYASDAKFDQVIDRKQSHRVENLTLKETEEFIESFCVPADNSSCTDEVFEVLPVEKDSKKIKRKVPFGKMKCKATELEKIRNGLANDEPIEEKFHSKGENIADFLRNFWEF